jgi:myo-inositol-1(or 4)-monophosphatase
MESLNLKALCHSTIDLVKEAGIFIRKEAKGFDTSKIEFKGRSNDLVSYVDKETEKILVAGLRKILPQAGFIGEEGTSEEGKDGLQWVIDPLDGTTNFLHGMPSFSISVALIQGTTILVGVVYEINLDECFYAWKDGGAYLNGNKISISPVNEMKRALIATGFPYVMRGKTDEYFEIIKNMVNESHGLRRLGSAAVDLCYVACGRFEAYFEFNIKIWDIAAGILLVQEAGGKVTDYSGGDDYLHGKELLAAGAIHGEALAIIQKYW